MARIEPHTNDKRQQSRDRNLAQHIMVLYWGGSLALDSGLVPQMFAAADEATRTHALEWIGRWLVQEGPSAKDEVVERLLALWAQRVEAVRAQPSKELSAFGWWFCSPQIPPEPRLQGLRSAVALSGGVKNSEKVVEDLAALSGHYPRESAELLAAMVEHEPDAWRIAMWDPGATTVLLGAQSSGDQDALQFAVETANRAAARGQEAWLRLLT